MIGSAILRVLAYSFDFFGLISFVKIKMPCTGGDESSKNSNLEACQGPNNEFQKDQVNIPARTWSQFLTGSSPKASASRQLSEQRTLSSIPRPNGQEWQYPSHSQFYQAMDRKGYGPVADDMKTVVPIHNGVNERYAC